MSKLYMGTVDNALYMGSKQAFMEWDRLLKSNWDRRKSKCSYNAFLDFRDNIMEEVAIVLDQELDE